MARRKSVDEPDGVVPVELREMSDTDEWFDGRPAPADWPFHPERWRHIVAHGNWVTARREWAKARGLSYREAFRAYQSWRAVADGTP